MASDIIDTEAPVSASVGTARAIIYSNTYLDLGADSLFVIQLRWAARNPVSRYPTPCQLAKLIVKWASWIWSLRKGDRVWTYSNTLLLVSPFFGRYSKLAHSHQN